MATSPAFAATPRVGMAQLTAANPNRDGTGTLATVLAAGTSGSKIERVAIIATGTTTAGMVRLFLHDGTNARLLKEIPVTAVTPSGTLKAFEAAVDFSGPDQVLLLPNGWSLRAATQNAEVFNVFAMAGDY